jgi:cyclopropane-fatty-acyl-phospholipid synthase
MDHTQGVLFVRVKHVDFSQAEKIIRDLFGQAGIAIGGSAPHDIRVKDGRFYPRVLGDGSLGLGEAYIDDWWECDAIADLIVKLIRAELHHKIRLSPRLVVESVKARVLNMQRPANAYHNIAHYDLGNELFEHMLGPTMAYSCGYWRDATDLDSAQRAKFDLICKKLMLQPGERLLDIGCGFGTLARHAAEHYGVHVVGITIAREQHAYAQKLCAGLPIDIRLLDYRELPSLGRFDKIVSVGMFEHVGVKNYRRYLELAAAALPDGGLFLLHTIGTGVSRMTGDGYLNKYIFPNGVLPSPTNLGRALEGVFVVEDWHNFGHDYFPTFMAWHANFQRYVASDKYPHDPRFTRMWTYFLQLFGASFKSRISCQLWQLVLSRRGVVGGYRSIR